MGCLTSIVTVPLTLLSWVSLAAAAGLLFTGYKARHAAMCEAGAGAGLLAAVLGMHLLGGVAVVAGFVGWLKFRALPGGEG